MKILNWTTEHDLDRLKRRGWIERQREPRPDERPSSSRSGIHAKPSARATTGHQAAIQRFRSLPLDRPVQLALFDGPSWTPVS